MKGGRVYITGAGPGDEKLITLRALELIREADVILYDRLGARNFLQFAKDGCEKIDAGKGPQHHTMGQELINDTLVQKAKEGKKVLRLKGGDPFLFGRGGEEAERLSEEGISFEIVPGVSSFYSAAAYAGIPVTHRECASSVHVFTGHRQKEKDLDYDVIAKIEGTLIFLMGMKHLSHICQQLIANGKNPATPVAVVQWGTTYCQKEVIGTLEDIVSLVEREKIGHPAVIVVGDVVRTKDKIAWQKYRFLWGKRILLTGSGKSVAEVKAYLQEEGAEVSVLPMMEIEEPDTYAPFDQELQRINEFTWIFFTSVRAVEVFFERMKKNRIDIRFMNHCKIFCIGEKTKQAIEEKGLFTDYMPQKFHSLAAVEEMDSFITKEDRIFFPASALADDTLEKKAREIGAAFVRVTTYRNHMPKRIEEDLLLELEEGKFDAIGFFSSSQVQHLWELVKEIPGACALCSIGPSTSHTIKEKKGKVTAEAEIATANGLAKAIEGIWTSDL